MSEPQRPDMIGQDEARRCARKAVHWLTTQNQPDGIKDMPLEVFYSCITACRYLTETSPVLPVDLPIIPLRDAMAQVMNGTAGPADLATLYAHCIHELPNGQEDDIARQILNRFGPEDGRRVLLTGNRHHYKEHAAQQRTDETLARLQEPPTP